ncbi:PAS domain-containing sensor histidine kinase [Donghicola sp. B5-SW-15]|uniref:histidine kinase n=1 Tax=Donghicola mangrovi TaxID=2729614 RepID=A0A850Q1E1_9RHOB|nr:PAS domain-containing sensor histidine kinase [Donghicola mangrovi]
MTQLRFQRKVQNVATLGLVILGPVLALLTYLVLGPLDQGMSSSHLRVILLADFIYVLLVAALVLGRVAQMIAARRARSAGSRLHLRLTGVFVMLALVPTVCVAVFATLTVNFGLEGWFSDRVQRVLGTSLAAAQAYEQEHRQDLSDDARALASYLEANRRAAGYLTDGDVRQLLASGQAKIQRGLSEAFVVNSAGDIKARGDGSYLFNFELPTQEQLESAHLNGIEIIEDWDRDEFRALVDLPGFVDRYLYVSRRVDGDILRLLDDTQQTVKLYQQLENDRGKLLFEFGLLYLGFALILILAAIWLGLYFAERLARPIGRLAGAAQRVGSGDLSIQVREEKGDDEIAMLGRYFNQMTRQLKVQRDTLLDNTDQIERRRRLFDSVLSSVTSGVVALDTEGKITLANRSAETMLGLEDSGEGQALAVIVPEFMPVYDKLCEVPENSVQEQIKLTRDGRMETLLVRMAARLNREGLPEGYVLAFDDVSDLVSAQRMAAWGDVARRIAHEIKNPLTPIRLSAERIRRKFAVSAGDDADKLEQLTDVIVRQTEDLRRIVDEFSKFARMPQPQRRPVDLSKVLRDAVVLQDVGQVGVTFNSSIPDHAVMSMLDETMISQAMINLIKNAGEAIESLKEKGVEEGFVPEIRIAMSVVGNRARIAISDNGIGLPEDRARLFEPYVTTREKGTGLGLPIVKKIIEEHGGLLSLEDAEPFAPGAHRGACAEILLPLDEGTQYKNEASE